MDDDNDKGDNYLTEGKVAMCESYLGDAIAWIQEKTKT